MAGLLVKAFAPVSLALQFVKQRRSSRGSPHVYDVHEPGIVVDGEEDAIDVRLPPVTQYPDWLIRIDALRRDGTALRVLFEGKNGPLETVEPLGALLRRPRHDPEGTGLRARVRRSSRSQGGMPCFRRIRANTCRAGLVRPAFTSANPR